VRKINFAFSNFSLSDLFSFGCFFLKKIWFEVTLILCFYLLIFFSVYPKPFSHFWKLHQRFYREEQSALKTRPNTQVVEHLPSKHKAQHSSRMNLFPPSDTGLLIPSSRPGKVNDFKGMPDQELRVIQAQLI
jgi:hypothetical protein